MKERIKEIIEKEDLTPAKFADLLQINRAVVSHILTGRNNPSLDVVMRILSEMDYINSDWLLNGEGNMYRDDYNRKLNTNKSSLFDQEATILDKNTDDLEYAQESSIKKDKSHNKLSESEKVILGATNSRKIKQIIIYFDDNTFETFTPQ